MALQFNRDITFEYAELAPVAAGVRRIVARNPSPYTLHGTGTYVIGTGDVVVIDPGPDDAAHVDALLTSLKGERVSHVLVTHTHMDHSPAAAVLRAHLGVEVWGCAPHRVFDDSFTGEAGGDTDYRPDRELRDGEVIAGPGWQVEVVHTPGHTSNHLCYALEPQGILFSGDHVMGWSTTVVTPPDGDMHAYMASLQRLAARGERTYWPTHGPAIDSPQAYVRALHTHRVEREAMVLAALKSGLSSIPELVGHIYQGLDPRLVRPAQRTTWAHLRKLTTEGRVMAQGTNPNDLDAAGGAHSASAADSAAATGAPSRIAADTRAVMDLSAATLGARYHAV